MHVQKIGITALVPPEVIFACGSAPYDVNNVIPASKKYPKSKLCAWTAIWQEMLVKREIAVEKLVVVAGGDCHNALVDGQKAAMSGIPTHFFFYPFDGAREYLEEQLYELSGFLGNLKYPERFGEIKKLKEMGQIIDRKRLNGKISSSEAFHVLISFSDLLGNLNEFRKTMDIKTPQLTTELTPHLNAGNSVSRVALIGVPPIYYDFHDSAEALGLHIVFDELPYEFVRHNGSNMREVAEDYCNYTFARPLDFRIEFLQKELERRKVSGVIHYTQFACHHVLEDEVLRKELDYPLLTIQGDLPGKTPEQIKLRLEAFREVIERK